jgi:hypothetical protein
MNVIRVFGALCNCEDLCGGHGMEKKVYIGFQQQGAGPTMPEFLFFLTTKSCEIEELKLRRTRFSILATGNAKLRAGGGESVCI